MNTVFVLLEYYMPAILIAVVPMSFLAYLFFQSIFGGK